MFSKFLIILASVNALCWGAENLPDAPPSAFVTIPQGKLEGSVLTSRNDNTFYQFLGVPYGKVPKRFGLSELADPWEGTKDTTKSGPWCLQYNFLVNKVMGEEDCLILNIYTSEISNKSASLPVMVFIHGGGFVQGSANEFGGKYLMNKDVVLVAINYRLGAMGFLNAEVKGASGNQGMKDQVLALKWIQKNIDNFGGDPNRVLIFGESAGGGAVSLLTLSPMTKGLFHAAISQSGSALCPFVDRKDPPLPEAKKLANLLDCPSSDSNYMIECLRRIKASDIITATKPKHLTHLYFDVYDVPQFSPSVEKYKEEVSTVFLPESPLKILTEGTFHKVPWMTGVNSQEGIVVQAAPILVNSTLTELINEEWGRVAPSTFLYHTSARDPCKLSSKIKEFYFGDEKISMNNSMKLVDLYSDRFFFHCAKQTATLYSKHAPVYLFFFSKGVEHTVSSLLGWPNNNRNGLKSPTHADDLQFFFDFPVIPYSPGIPKGNSLEEFSDKIINLWTSFARDGKPSEIWGSEKEWPMLNALETPMKWMNIDTDLTIVDENSTLTSRLEFWDQLLRPIQIKDISNSN